MDKALNYLSLARKGGMAELGEEPVAAITRTGKGYLVIVASDASDHTWRRAKSLVAGTDQQCVRVPFTKDELGFVIGRTSLAIAAITDAALALALVKALPDPEKNRTAIESLEVRAARLRQRQKEEKAHKRNVRMGRKK
jgi:ribosomal protein L7Ae-like RNA K-turn-binding protein